MTTLSIDKHDCLLIIDVQNDFCPGGALAVPQAEDILPVINELSNRFEHIVLTQDWHPEGHGSFASQHPHKQPFATVTLPYGEQTLWPDHCVQGSDGAQFHPQLDTRKAQLIVRKGFRRAIDSYSAFFENDRTTSLGLGGFLKERDIRRVVCVGLALDYCVRFSTLDARAQGFAVCVVQAGCRGIDIEGSNADALAAMSDAGVVLA